MTEDLVSQRKDPLMTDLDKAMPICEPELGAVMPRRICVASSWRNDGHPDVVHALEEAGHDVYDFRNPAPGDCGFSWSEIDPEWGSWTPAVYVDRLKDPAAQRGFAFDKAALDWCDTCVLVLPCGRSAHLEAGYAAGQGKRVVVLLSDRGFEPELMYLLCSGFALDIPSLLRALAVPRQDVTRIGDRGDSDARRQINIEINMEIAQVSELRSEYVAVSALSGVTYEPVLRSIADAIERAVAAVKTGDLAAQAAALQSLREFTA